MQQHDLLTKVLQTMLQYDQLDLSNLASVELMFRELQGIEEKHADKFSKDASADAAGERQLFLGSDYSPVMVCPSLKEWMAEQLKSEAMIMKERRKAREERNLARGPKGPAK